MFIKPGEIISISHHSINILRSEVVDVQDHESGGQVLAIHIMKEFADCMLFEGDTVAIAFRSGDNIYTTSCHIINIDIDKNVMQLVVENEEYVINHRAFERFPVSLYSSVVLRNSKSEFAAVVKNISFSGLLICSKMEIESKQNIDLKLYLSNIPVNLTAEVVWSMKNEYTFDYGLRIIHMEYSHQNVLRKYLENLKVNQEVIIQGG
ncbi:PilZ domain-containing protein [Pseudobacteroides cellulosolvens]|uniref:Type IV pilus assembly PilZ n=1 Tax=Pseudobacteroides cellulosolvens ATCC 35603 = DSM 2933 TaxID=398512 RepID=A0A0L6JXC3_9FIRM|nr:PilZ domain-containing protein [Pseudobacteroides cellulosolvens]KNY30394.1 type IV pilus assembly PilZ [Pseudobacteroides cellulosolvens ATCC 35603 = DSM 2933]